MAESKKKKKSYDFSIQIVELYQHLSTKKQEFIIGRQLLRSWTSIWALLREAEFAQSRADFINKMSIALKEANETLYRLDILQDTWYIDAIQYNDLYPVWQAILKMLVSAIKTSKKTSWY